MKITLAESKLSLYLNKEKFQISAFDSYFVVGETNSNEYLLYIKFYNYELDLLYKHLRSIIDFLSNDSLELDLPLNIIKQSTNIAYSWQGMYENPEKQEVKLVKFILKSKNINNVWILNLEFVVCLLTSISNIFFCTFNISSEEKFFLHLISNENEEILNSFQVIENKTLLEFITKFINIFPNMSIKKYELSQLYLYLLKDIKIISEIKTLVLSLSSND